MAITLQLLVCVLRIRSYWRSAIVHAKLVKLLAIEWIVHLVLRQKAVDRGEKGDENEEADHGKILASHRRNCFQRESWKIIRWRRLA